MKSNENLDKEELEEIFHHMSLKGRIRVAAHSFFKSMTLWEAVQDLISEADQPRRPSYPIPKGGVCLLTHPNFKRH